jgi:fructose transport system substrate-binding protein
MKKQMRTTGVLLVVAATAMVGCGSSKKTTTAAATTAAPAAGATTAAAAPAAGGAMPGVALIVKTATNPFFVSMKKSADENAAKVGVKLTFAAGTKDGDSATQIKAIEDAIARKDAGILITPTSDDVNPAIKKARDAGLYVIALDTVPTPAETVDITFATDNLLAGVNIGKWTAAKLDGKKATIAMLDLFNDKVVSVDTARDQGFLMGMGIIDKEDPSGNGKEPKTGKYKGGKGGDYEVVCHEQSNGSTDDGKKAMETCLAKNPNINVIYGINEPAAAGGVQAAQAKGLKDLIVVGVDGGCSGVGLVKAGTLGATSQQYPGEMVNLGMQAIKKIIDSKGADKPKVSEGKNFFNTGTKLITDTKVDGLESISTDEGAKICWGAP